MKVGDKLYCRQEYTRSYLKWITKGKLYPVVKIFDNSFYILDDQGEENQFSIDE
jgi:hypothetical protein